jgi:hypothetical protein
MRYLYFCERDCGLDKTEQWFLTFSAYCLTTRATSCHVTLVMQRHRFMSSWCNVPRTSSLICTQITMSTGYSRLGIGSSGHFKCLLQMKQSKKVVRLCYPPLYTDIYWINYLKVRAQGLNILYCIKLNPSLRTLHVFSITLELIDCLWWGLVWNPTLNMDMPGYFFMAYRDYLSGQVNMF